MKFVNSHLEAINSTNDFKVFNPCLTRLNQYMSKLSSEDNTLSYYQCNSP